MDGDKIVLKAEISTALSSTAEKLRHENCL